MQNASALFCILFFQTLIFYHAFYGVFYIPQRDAFVFKIRLVHILVVDYQVWIGNDNEIISECEAFI